MRVFLNYHRISISFPIFLFNVIFLGFGLRYIFQLLFLFSFLEVKDGIIDIGDDVSVQNVYEKGNYAKVRKAIA